MLFLTLICQRYWLTESRMAVVWLLIWGVWGVQQKILNFWLHFCSAIQNQKNKIKQSPVFICCTINKIILNSYFLWNESLHIINYNKFLWNTKINLSNLKSYHNPVYHYELVSCAMIGWLHFSKNFPLFEVNITNNAFWWRNLMFTCTIPSLSLTDIIQDMFRQLTDITLYKDSTYH